MYVYLIIAVFVAGFYGWRKFKSKPQADVDLEIQMVKE